MTWLELLALLEQVKDEPFMKDAVGYHDDGFWKLRLVQHIPEKTLAFIPFVEEGSEE